MKYLCLVYGEENAIMSMPVNHCVAYDESIRASGKCIASEALQPVATATTVRVKNGKTLTPDGPFAETREQLGGFFMVEAKDLDAAIALAAGIPGARMGSIEVRPIRPTPPVD